MKSMTCDKDNMKKITEQSQDYTNNKAAMEEIANSDYKSASSAGRTTSSFSQKLHRKST
jgi:hypothetical protein